VTPTVDPKTAWANWHARQAQTWKEFEQKHFSTGLCFMQKWNEIRVGQMQRVLGKYRFDTFDILVIHRRTRIEASGRRV